MDDLWEQEDTWKKVEKITTPFVRHVAKGGGRSLTASLCGRCEHGLVARCESTNELTTHCTVLGKSAPPDIVECTQYRTSGSDSHTIEEMVKVALIIDPRVLPGEKTYL